jgi:hypothetical protein
MKGEVQRQRTQALTCRHLLTFLHDAIPQIFTTLREEFQSKTNDLLYRLLGTDEPIVE